ncbi:MAG TPA: NepR family anti-sigma factor [Beijerinckiaceae bacterium]
MGGELLRDRHAKPLEFDRIGAGPTSGRAYIFGHDDFNRRFGGDQAQARRLPLARQGFHLGLHSMTNKQPKTEAENLEEELQIDEHVQRRIGTKLRSYYDELLSEPIPDKFIELLMKLDEKERKEDHK